MSLQIGQQLGFYEITALLGKGGMGEVYRAKDNKLKRDVAIKILPDEFSRDAARVGRFQREAEVLASLNHPNIGAIYDLQQADDRRFLVLELVEGDTLAERVQRGPFRVEEALEIGRQICEALEAAHDRGIVHRDLKPGNIKLGPNAVKVLDFGLATTRSAEMSSAAFSDLSTMTSASTPGTILGTAGYMSPEQARGEVVDRATDIWAFGCVLYETLTARSAFEGKTSTEVLAGVLKTDPDWRLLPDETPPNIRRLLCRCLQKDQKSRIRDSRDVRIEIEEAQNPPATEGEASSAPLVRKRPLWIAAIVAIALLGGLALYWRPRPAPVISEMRLEITTPPTLDPVSFALSPDGQKIAFVATSEGRPRLWLRSLASSTTRPLTGTDFASSPFWSPDNRSLGFFADGKLKRIDIDGSSPHNLADAPNSRGGTWNTDGVIVFAPSGGRPLFQIAATGGEPAALTQLDEPKQGSHRYPQFLPDGRHFLYYAQGSPEASGVYVSNLDRSVTLRLLAADGGAVYASGHLLFVRQGVLFAQAFDLSSFALAGEPIAVAEQLAVDNEDNVALSASAVGPIVFRTGSIRGLRQLAWFDRSGTELEKVGSPIAGPLVPSLSPDQRRVALFRTEGGNVDIWLLELAGGRLTRFTTDAANEVFPIWSADGNHVAFTSRTFFLYEKPANGVGSQQLLMQTPELQTKNPVDWSRDGRFLLYRSLDLKTSFDLWALPLFGDKKPFPVVQTNFDERDGQFSPDGKWIAYQSNETGRFEIYVQSFPGPSAKSLVSSNGGAQVRWRDDGKELFYVALDGHLMAVPIKLDLAGKTLESGEPTPLFATRVGGAVQSNYKQQYMVASNGQRFLMNVLIEEPNSPITIMLNWKPKS